MENKVKEILRLENICFSYHTLQGEIEAIKDLNLSVYEHEFVSIIGPSGSGKTTILSLIAGLIKPSHGKILFYGEEDENFNTKIGYMLQKDHLFDWRTVYQNIMLGPELKGKEKSPEINAHVTNLLENYGIIDFKKNYPRQLSGGMKQRVALIRTLALNPHILLLDEPFSALDYQTRLKVSDDVLNIIEKEKKTAILVTHDISEAISMSDRVFVLSQRPAKVKNVFEINLKQFGTPLQRRESQGFHKIFDIVWKELQYEE
jgi:NitT/TauT family transport system ATP-binding protein